MIGNKNLNVVPLSLQSIIPLIADNFLGGIIFNSVFFLSYSNFTPIIFIALIVAMVSSEIRGLMIDVAFLQKLAHIIAR